MQRAAVNLGIVVYLSALAWGSFSHSLGYKQFSHPAMYYLVWDMFAGANWFESRTYILGEGESGTVYEISPPPWGGPQPWGYVHRASGDASFRLSGQFARNTLRYTDHEPIQRMFVVEETWAKMYNIPDELWAERFEEPKDPRKYYTIVRVLDPQGEVESKHLTWASRMYSHSIMSNPRLAEEARNSKQVFQLEGYSPGRPDTTVDPTVLRPLAD